MAASPLRSLICHFVLAGLSCAGWAADHGGVPIIQFSPGVVKPGDELTITVRPTSGQSRRYYLQSPDYAQLPVNPMIDESDAVVTRTGNWTSHRHGKGVYGESFINSPEPGATVEIPFTGEFFRIYGFKAANRGIVEIHLDGKKIGEADAFATNERASTLLFEHYGLKNAKHVVKLVVSGRKNAAAKDPQISFDALETGAATLATRIIAKTEGYYSITLRTESGDQAASRLVGIGMARPGAGVQLSSANPLLQRVFDAILQANQKNEERMKDGRRVLVEGDIWRGIWLETQPMGGSMYGKFDLEIARNNLEVVINGQLANGQLPHLTHLDGKQWNGAIGFNAVAHYGLDAYYLFRKDPDFLEKLETALTRYDAYLWQERDKNGNGVLEAFCTTDTGEDGQTGNRYDLLRGPEGNRFVDSVSVTADSYANREVLARIAAIRGDEAKRVEWQGKADALRKKSREYFWVEKRKAAFDRDSKGEILPALNQLNIRAMTQGLFSQEMADDFVKYHLMNPQEFFTPYPIPSTAINDPTFHNVEKATEYSTWSGPSMGLTLQRSVRALENYGHYVEIGLIGQKLIERIGREPVNFPVQFNPITGDAVARVGGYGPMILATMEYLSRMYGVYVSRDTVVWNGFPGSDLEYAQTWHDTVYAIVHKNGRVSGFRNGQPLFEVPAGLRVETDYQGAVIRMAGLSATTVSGALVLGKTTIPTFTTQPNQIHVYQDGKLAATTSAPFAK